MSSTIPSSSSGEQISLGILGCANGEPAANPSDFDIAEQVVAEEQTVVKDLRLDAEPEKIIPPQRPRHRVGEVRQQQGISQRTLARRMQVDIKTYQAMERPDADLTLSQLMQLQVALDVPMIDLLEDSQTLSRPVAERAKMVKVMKTAAALRELKSNARIQRLTTMLCEQLTEVMPELAEVSGWPQFGARRGKSAIGKALMQPIDTSNLRIE